MNIRYATEKDYELLCQYDIHIDKSELKKIITDNKILLLYDNDNFIGWLRYNLFWDNIPFMNILYILDGNRNKGYGKKLVEYWENEMRKNYDFVLTSTQANEKGQFFYRKNGYVDIGSFVLPKEVSEIILYKKL